VCVCVCVCVCGVDCVWRCPFPHIQVVFCFLSRSCTERPLKYPLPVPSTRPRPCFRPPGMCVCFGWFRHFLHYTPSLHLSRSNHHHLALHKFRKTNVCVARVLYCAECKDGCEHTQACPRTDVEPRFFNWHMAKGNKINKGAALVEA
jgi:hypothetical protein